VDAGLAVFGDQGFHASTVRDVCRQAQLTSRYFYESFESMEALFCAVYTDINRGLMRNTIAALSQCQPTAEDCSEAALRAFLEFIREDPRRARVALIDALNVGERMTTLAQQANQDFSRLTAGFLEQFFPEVTKLGLNPVIVADGLVGAANRIATQWVATRCEAPLDEVLHNSAMLFKACASYTRQALA